MQTLKHATQTTLGIDEAGRGAILGPLLLAGVVVEPHQQAQLLKWGVQDSKIFGSSPKARLCRAELAKKICGLCQAGWLEVSAPLIDQFVLHQGLNRLEQICALKIIHSCNAFQIVLDGEKIFSPLKKIVSHRRVLCVDRADTQFISVAAASIVAKHHRDEAFQQYTHQFKHSYGAVLGMGYANPPTLQFIQWHKNKAGTLPHALRQQFFYKALNHT